jgi:hypothetical protein
MTAPKLSDELCQQIVDAVAAHGNLSAAGRALGLPYGTALGRQSAARIRKFTANVQAIPPSAAIPEGYKLKGTSTLYDGDGNMRAQWIKTNADLEQQLQATVKAITEVFSSALKVDKIPAPKICNKQLLTVYPIGDQHHGMLAWGEEVGADYDVKISETLLSAAARHLVAVAPPSAEAIVINLGDYFHVDNLKNVTSQSGNVLDVDTRYAAMIRGGVRLMRTVVECALRKHARVKVICVIGNHDEIGAMWLQTALALLYEQNPRVTVVTQPGKFHYHQHGKVLIGTTHGDTGNPAKLQGVMAADRPEMWGATEHRYWLTGHVHTRRVVEFPGVMWETFRTLASADAWARGAGYRQGRDMTAIVFHTDHGEIARHRFDVSMLETP